MYHSDQGVDQVNSSKVHYDSHKDKILFDSHYIYIKAYQAVFSALCSFADKPLKLPNLKCVLQYCYQCPNLK